MDKNNSILFTDPASLGIDGYYSSKGDVDDLACIIYMSQKLEGNLTTVICEDESGERYSSFMTLIGNKLKTNYGIEILKEVEFTNIPSNADIYIHAPILNSTAAKLLDNIENIDKVCTQGADDKAYNFKNNLGATDFLNKFKGEKPNNLHRYDTEETTFTISYDPEFQNTLTVKNLNEIYYQYFLFQQRKSFGTALNLGICNRLYSDTGLNGGPGNGIKKYKDLIQILKDEGKLTPIKGELLEAYNNTISPECDESAIQNGKDLISLMNLYCNYTDLIVNGKLPNMGNLGEIKKRIDVDKRVSVLFDIVPGFNSTPLFDFAAAYFTLSGKKADVGELKQAALLSLTEVNIKLSNSTISGGKRKRKTLRKKNRLKRSKITKNNKNKKSTKKTKNKKTKNKKKSTKKTKNKR